MTDDEKLHVEASGYATRRREAYIKAMKEGRVDAMSEKDLNIRWLAHYDGYREGYWVATGDTKFTTDPAELKEENT